MMAERARFMPSRLLFPSLGLCVVAQMTAFAGAPDEDWKALVALDAGPETAPKNVVEARRIMTAHVGKQEQAAREFLKEHSRDPRTFEARLRLARILQIKADMQDAKIASPEVDALIREAEKMAAPEQRADVEFARLSYTMRSARDSGPDQRQRLLDATRVFQSSHPNDRRIPALLTEIATLFDAQPKVKHSLLVAAQQRAEDEDLRSRIADDLRRVEMVGQPVSLRFEPPQGDPVSIADHKGKVVVLVFFAAWSPPAVEAVLDLQKVLPGLPADQVQFIGVSLDTKPEPLEEFVEAQKIKWPIICDGKGWESPLVRSLGINAIPTVWLLDREGRLKSLNALERTTSQIQDLLRTRSR
jgi:peroxiredoxin